MCGYVSIEYFLTHAKMINSLKQNRKKDNVRIKVFTYPRSSTLKFASEQTDPYSHRDC